MVRKLLHATFLLVRGEHSSRTKINQVFLTSMLRMNVLYQDQHGWVTSRNWVKLAATVMIIILAGMYQCLECNVDQWPVVSPVPDTCVCGHHSTGARLSLCCFVNRFWSINHDNKGWQRNSVYQGEKHLYLLNGMQIYWKKLHTWIDT